MYVEEFFKENDYFIRITKSKGVDGCIAEFPANLVTTPFIESEIFSYVMEEDGFLYRSSMSSDESITECPVYAMRIIIFRDILRKVDSLKISPKLIFYYSETGDELPKDSSFVDIMGGPLSPDDIIKEGKLAELFYISHPDSYNQEDLAEHYGVQLGYKMLQTEVF